MENLDSETINKINKLAESLKEKHLASNMDDAMVMAKEIILKSDPAPPGVSNSIEQIKEIDNNIRELTDKIEHEVLKISDADVAVPYKEIEKKMDQMGSSSNEKADVLQQETKVQDKQNDVEEQMTVDQVAKIISANPKAVELIKNTPEVFIEKTKYSPVLQKLFKHVDINDVIAVINPNWNQSH